MTSTRLLIHSLFLLALPLIVAWFGISLTGAALLVVLALLWRWVISLSGILAPAKVPDIELETIAASHFVEKVRWCLDRLGIDYEERQAVGSLGVFFTGRTVPKLKFRTGLVRSNIGNSPEILRYLWGAYAVELGDRAKFLEPTKERLALEQKLDRYGVNLQVWVYYHILTDRALTLHAWGCNGSTTPAWQRYLAIAIYPVLRFLMRKAFRITKSHYNSAVEHIEALLSEIDATLADGRASILGDSSINYVDITFASLSGLWSQTPEYGCGKADQVRVDIEKTPVEMKADVERWIGAYPHANTFIRRLYKQERQNS